MRNTDVLHCPDCHEGTLFVDVDAETEHTIAPAYFVLGVDTLERRRGSVIVAGCNACEFVMEIRR